MRFFLENRTNIAHADSHRRKPAQMRHLFVSFYDKNELDGAHEEPHKRETI